MIHCRWTATIIVVLITLALVVSAAVAADVPVDRIYLNYSNLVLARGETEILTATIAPADASNKRIRWISSNNQVAQVVSLSDIDGYYLSAEVKAMGPGSATITVITEDGEKRAYCAIEVVVLVNNLTVTPANLTVTKGDKIQLTATVLPPDATEQRITWESADPSVAAVEQNGLVSALKTGETRVIARSIEDLSINGYCTLVVAEESVSFETEETAEPEPLAEPEIQPEPVENQGFDYNYIIIGALVVVIIIALIFIINSKRR